ncbi:hypothetical protein A4G99_18410 [Haladaptatus sp. R4]|uniref:SHOCT domain-containing protein n=1 Tax=Haladaptatus sp. R4 TaxID=1679489 RepID=UPI0007B47760|nr:SHOCT domain-containing protein [Haladaptatus sp. R4]KZN22725.1 hypothetical protein A4G99_18410 [Haladaptatus sp. R4]
MSGTPIERFQENATEIASILVTGIWLLALLTGQGWWLWALLGGYIVVIPIVELLFGDEDEEEAADEPSSRKQRRQEHRERRRNRRRDRWEDDPQENDDGTRGAANNRDALETLKDRYARGELTDEQFERKLEKLMENDTVEDVEDRFRTDRERNLERE